MEHEHSKQAIATRVSGAPSVSYLRDWGYGGIGGAVTNFAIVAGGRRGALEPGGPGSRHRQNLVADGSPMAASNCSGTKTEHEEQAHLRALKERHIAAVPTASARRFARSSAARACAGRTSSERST